MPKKKGRIPAKEFSPPPSDSESEPDSEALMRRRKREGFPFPEAVALLEKFLKEAEKKVEETNEGYSRPGKALTMEEISSLDRKMLGLGAIMRRVGDKMKKLEEDSWKEMEELLEGGGRGNNGDDKQLSYLLTVLQPPRDATSLIDFLEEETCDQVDGNAMMPPSEEPRVTCSRGLEHHKETVEGHAVKAQSKVQQRKREWKQLEGGHNKDTDRPEVKKEVKEEVEDEGEGSVDWSWKRGIFAPKGKEKGNTQEKGSPGATVNSKNGKPSEVVVKEEEVEDAVPSKEPPVEREKDGGDFWKGAKIHAKPKRRPSFPVEDWEVDLHQKDEIEPAKRSKPGESEDEEHSSRRAEDGREGEGNEQVDGMVGADTGGMDSDINGTESPLEEKPEVESRGVNSDGEEEEKRIEPQMDDMMNVDFGGMDSDFNDTQSPLEEKPVKSKRTRVATNHRLEKEKRVDDSDEGGEEEEERKPVRRSFRRTKPVKCGRERESDDDSSDEDGGDSSDSEEEQQQRWRKRIRRRRSYASDDGIGDEAAGEDSVDGDEEMDQSMDEDVRMCRSGRGDSADRAAEEEQEEDEMDQNDTLISGNDQAVDQDDSMDDGNEEKKCPVDGCSETLSSSEDLAKHMKKHPTPMICRVCKRSWPRGANLRIHYRKHSGEKPFKCGICKKGFTRGSDLRVHQRIHSGERPYACNVCEYKAFDASRLKRHQRIHTGEKPFQCTVCKRHFARSSYLTEHKRIHTGKRPSKCDKCDYKASCSSSLTTHKRTHTENSGLESKMESTFKEEGLFSNVKEEIFDPEENQIQLTKGNDEKPFVKEEAIDAFEVKKEAEDEEIVGYGECATREEAEFHGNQSSRKRKWSPGVEGNKYVIKQDIKEEVEPFAAFNVYEFLSNQDLMEGCVQDEGTEDFDVNRENGKEEEIPMENTDFMNDANEERNCPVDGCAEMLGSSEDLLRHIKKHPKPMLCGICKRSWSSGYDLRRHYMSHTGEKPFPCTVCRKQFNSSWGVNRHMRSHTGEMPYECDICGYKLSTSGNLKAHLRSHSGDKPHSCTLCMKRFISSSDLTRHMRIHTRDKPQKCEYATSDQCVLKRHKRSHTGEKPYPCTVCKKNFAQASHLAVHMRLHTGELPYECDVCGFKTSRVSSLKVHKRIHSGEKSYSCATCGYKTAQSGALDIHKKRHSH